MMEREQYLDEPEVAALLKAARTLAPASLRHRRDWLLLALLANTGVRPGEAVTLRVADLRLAGHEPWLRVHRLKKRCHQGVIDDLPLSRALAGALRSYVADARLADDARLFPLTVRQAERIFRRFALAAQLEGHRTLYSLRHSLGTRMVRESGDLVLVQRQLGHASISTTQRYLHVDPAWQRRAAERAGSLL